MDEREVLPSGQAHPGELFRLGDAVHRPVGPYSPAVHDYLRHLGAMGFPGAPRLRGFDPEGREVLDYLVGDVPREPLPDWAGSDRTLVSVARLQRGLHRASAGYRPSPDMVWHEPEPPAAYRGGLVCHNDWVPDNVVFRDGLAVGAIDFDLAAPVDPIWDVAVALRHWLPARAPEDLDPVHVGRPAGPRLAAYCAAYGLSDEDRPRLLDALADCVRYAYEFVRAKAEAGEPAWVAIAEARAARHLRSGDWLVEQRPELETWLFAGHVDGRPPPSG